MKPFGIDVVMIEPGGIKTEWGHIAADHLAESTKGTAYEETGLQEAKNFHWMYETNYLSKPAVVMKTMVKAVNSRRPRARYRTGAFANTIVFWHSVLPTRWWDAIVRSLGKIKAPEK